ncbi:FtsK/SpoIIIE domain-containing protein [Mailhella sp.]
MEERQDLQILYQLLYRLLSTIPVGRLEVTAFDPLGLGQSLAPFLSLLKAEKLFPHERILTAGNEIEEVLKNLAAIVEDCIQNRFSIDIPDWVHYNTAHREKALPYRVIILFGTPSQLSVQSLWSLGSLLRHGPRCGILPIISMPPISADDRASKELRETMNETLNPLGALAGSGRSSGVKTLTLSFIEDSLPNRSVHDAFLTAVAAAYAQEARNVRPMSSLWQTGLDWKNSSREGIRCPIGWTAAGELVYFTLGNVHSQVHALIAGRSGSGKSNLLHVLLHSLCHSYGPEELGLYLLDYKHGTEFSVYAAPPLPQARLVAMASDTEYGVTVLKHLCQEIELRAALFKEAKVNGFEEWKRLHSSALPRLLLVIDEFQVLFSEARNIADEAEKALTMLLRQGRAYGIHVILATQTLKGIQSTSMSQLISQIGCRIALACSEDDSSSILGANNWAAAKLKSPPEGILNEGNGAKDANIVFRIPEATKEFCMLHLQEISSCAADLRQKAHTRLFNGTKLPEIPSRRSLYRAASVPVTVHLGEMLNYEASPMTLTFEPRGSSALLITSGSTTLMENLARSVLRSLRTHAGVGRIVSLESPFYSELLDDECRGDGIPIERYHDLEEFDIGTFTKEMGNERRFLVIFGLDSMKALITPPGPRFSKEAPPTAADQLRTLLEDGPRKKTYIIAFVDSWKRFAASGRDLQALIEWRIGSCLPEEDSTALIGGKVRSLSSDMVAIFSDRIKGTTCSFRPYTTGSPHA